MSIRLGLNISTSPRSLFAAFTAPAIAKLLFSDDEAGFFYDFDDWSTLFQDTAGTIPVTAPEQGVALALDKRLGLELGPELFPTTAAFIGTGWSVTGSGGGISLVQDGSGSGGIDRFEYAGFSGRFLETKFTVSGAGTVNFRDSITVLESNLGAGEYTVRAYHTTNWNFAPTGTAVTISNISVRELAGNHATQATTAARPLTAVHPDGGVRNLLDRSEELTTSPWDTLEATVTASGDAWKVVADSGTNGSLRNNYTTDNNGQTETISITAKADDARYVHIGRGGAGVWFDLQDGVVLISFTGSTGTISTPDADGYRRVSVEYIESFFENGLTTTVRIYPSVNAPSSNSVASGGGNDGVKGILVKNAQRERGTLTPYQRRVNFLNVTEAGKRSIRRLYFNGTSHFMTTPTITPNTDKAQVFAGVRKLSDAPNRQTIAESSFGNQFGSFFIEGPGFDTNFRVGSTGTLTRSVSFFAPAPASAVISATSDISGEDVSLRVDGTQVGQNTADQGTGNYLAYPVFIGARAGTTLFFNGFLDQLIGRFGATPDETTIGKVEKYTSIKVPELVAASEVTWNASADTYTQNLVGLGR